MTRIALLLGAALTLAACPMPWGGGFDDPTDPVGETRVTGTVFQDDGSPAPKAVAYLTVEGRAVAQAETDAAGLFTIRVMDIVGRGAVVINDKAGQGAFRDVNLYSGDNDAGVMYLAPLEQIAPVLDLAGVGFEERVTTERGDYGRAVYNSDVTTVYATRKLSGEDLYEIVAIDLATGEERVIREDEDLYTNGTTFQLLTDDVLYYRAYRSVWDDTYGGELRYESHVLIRTDDGTELWSGTWKEVRGGPFVGPAGIVVLHAFDSRFLYDSLFGNVDEYRVRAINIGLDGAVTEGDTFPTWLPYFSLAQASATTAAVVPGYDCDFEQPGCDPWSVQLSLYELDLQSLDLRYVTTVGNQYDNTFVVGDGAWNGESLLMTSAAQLTRVDMASGQKTSLGAQDCMSDTGCVTSYPRPVYDGHRMLVPLMAQEMIDGTMTSRALGYHWLDTESGALTALDLTHSIDGESFTLCQSDTSARCTAALGADGTVRITEVFAQEETGPRQAVIVDLREDGTVNARMFDVGEEDYSAPAVYDRPDGAQQAIRLRDLETGFHQLLVGGPNSKSSELVRLTFITADHFRVTWAPDGEHLYYFTRDPISGYEQLFRVATTGAPSPQ